MKKLVYGIVCLIVILCAAVFLGKNYLPHWISSTLSKKMGVNVVIKTLSVTPRTAEVGGLTISNPKGFILNTALKVGAIQADTSILTFLHQHVVIDKVVASDLYLGLEFASVTNTTGNWTLIMQNLQNSLGQSETDSGKTFLIKTLAVNNINIDLVFRKNDGKIRRLKPIPYMEFKNISSEGPFPMEQLTKIVMSEVLKKIFLENNLKNMLQDAFQNPSQGVYNSFKSLFSLNSEEEEASVPPLLLP